MSDTFHFASGPDDDKPMPVDAADRWRGTILNLLDASNASIKENNDGSVVVSRKQLFVLAASLERFRRMEVQMRLIGRTISSVVGDK